MNILVVAMGLLCALVLTSTAISLFALHRAHRLIRQMNQRPEPAPPGKSEEVQDLRDAVEALAAQLVELRKSPPVALEPAVPRPGLNLSKRSQALRMHRRGENPDQIAAELQLPRQEVGLLLKVHQIVMSNV